MLTAAQLVGSAVMPHLSGGATTSDSATASASGAAPAISLTEAELSDLDDKLFAAMQRATDVAPSLAVAAKDFLRKFREVAGLASGGGDDGDDGGPPADGQAKRTYPSGDVYDGQWKDGRRDGRGRMTYADGSVYEGDYVSDEKEGQGSYTYVNGDVYVGGFEGGLRGGAGGTMRFADGRVIVTRYKGGQPSGEGVGWSADSDRAWLLADGKGTREIDLDEARELAEDVLGSPLA